MYILHKELFECKNGVVVQIAVGKNPLRGCVATVFDLDDGEIGSFEFSECENSDGDYYLKLGHMFLTGHGNSYKRQGIGRRCLEIVSDLYGMMQIVAEGHDGSHLTGDGPFFVEKMRAEGLIAPSDENEGSHDYEENSKDGGRWGS